MTAAGTVILRRNLEKHKRFRGRPDANTDVYGCARRAAHSCRLIAVIRRPAPNRVRLDSVRADDFRVVAQGGLKRPPWLGNCQAASDSMPNRSFTADRSFCLHPR
jgi:hypothetical protein